ncbi:MAG: histidine phosphatase family protein, partial [Spirochaetales bacterium]|nr:histidine phosphatase family protein [Spirochaetales bacterium]
NAKNKICGSTDIDLTELGHKQAIELGKKIKNDNLKIDEILCSPLRRAAYTAKHIHEQTGIPLTVEPSLTEQSFGKYESTPRDNPDFFAARQRFIDSYNGGESMFHLAQRIYNLLDKLKTDKKTYLLVAHGGIARVVNSYFYDMTNEEYANF